MYIGNRILVAWNADAHRHRRRFGIRGRLLLGSMKELGCRHQFKCRVIERAPLQRYEFTAASLEEFQGERVQALSKRHFTIHFIGAVQPVVVDRLLPVDEQAGAIVTAQAEDIVVVFGYGDVPAISHAEIGLQSLKLAVFDINLADNAFILSCGVEIDVRQAAQVLVRRIHLEQ